MSSLHPSRTPRRARRARKGTSMFRCLRKRRRDARASALFALPILLALTTAAYAQSDPGPESEDDREHAHEHEHDVHDDTETIVVTGSPLEHDRDELAIPIDRIEKKEMLLNLGSTLGETLSRVPGLTTSGFASGASRD